MRVTGRTTLDKATYPCSRCEGKGRLPCFSNVLGGVCFKCSGTGRQESKPAPRAIAWGVFGVDRFTGLRSELPLYNVRAKTATEAIAKARVTFAGASAAFKDQYSLENAIAFTHDELAKETI